MLSCRYRLLFSAAGLLAIPLLPTAAHARPTTSRSQAHGVGSLLPLLDEENPVLRDPSGGSGTGALIERAATAYSDARTSGDSNEAEHDDIMRFPARGKDTPAFPMNAWIALIACSDVSYNSFWKAKESGAVGAILDDTCLEAEQAASLLEAPSAWFRIRMGKGLIAVEFSQGHGTLTLQARGGGGSQASTSMIVLYTITGVVSGLFCIVIVIGIIRAIRHPERYSRGGEGFSGGAGGTLTRAILDTFPVIKFHSEEAPPNPDTSEKDLPRESVYEMGALHDDNKMPVSTVEHMHVIPTLGREQQALSDDEDPVASPSSVQATPQLPPARAPRPRDTTQDDPMPDQIGRETCPICIVDFEEGDDLRVLPCEGQHRFHQSCVDPWLLELSTSCPICRQDFGALQDIISGSADGVYRNDSGQRERRSMSYGRFSRYLRFARRRQGEHPSAVPPLPTSPEPSD